MIRQQNIKIISNTVLVPGKIFLMELESSYVSRKAKPGQFVEIRCGETLDPLLPRPFSIHDAKDNKIKILYRIVGEGTKLLSLKRSGDKISVLGPLGTGFSIDKKKKKSILFVGGMGVAPLYFLAHKLIEKNIDVELYFGAKSSENLITIAPFKKLGIKIHIATEDGSCGKKGLITCLLDNKLFVGAGLGLPSVYTCGPRPMMKEIAKWALKNNITGQASLEKEMACGVGVCLGCVVKIKGEYKRVCKEGPVFGMNEVDWDEE
ncbi:MAG: dihydroorotate dehydrogenase electron transfer subunit [bacterium]